MNHLIRMRLLHCLSSFFFLLACSCSERIVGSDDVEYRTDENGSKSLYEISNPSPYGFQEVNGDELKPSFVVDYFTDQEIKNHKIELGLWDSFLQFFTGDDEEKSEERFRIGFVNGLKHGPFEFRHPNGKIRLQGNYKNGKRHGKFLSYGKIGELIYEKNFRNGELDGNFSLYYVASKSDIFRYKKSLMENKKLVVKNHIRLRARFSNGKPVGKYESFDHPRGVLNLEESDLLSEEGYFDEDGLLAQEQIKLYPKTKRLFVVLPVDDRVSNERGKSNLENNEPRRIEFEASEYGFSKAIDTARSSFLEIPRFRNPDRKPSLVYSADEKRNLIAPIWSSDIDSIVLRNAKEFSVIEKFDPIYESFTNFALPRAIEMDANSSQTALEIVGLDSFGRKIDVLWSNQKDSPVIPLHKRIFAQRTKTRRTWSQGSALEADWFLDDGSKILLRGDDDISIGHLPVGQN